MEHITSRQNALMTHIRKLNASRAYDVVDTTNDQVFKGVDSSTKNAARAVQEDDGFAFAGDPRHRWINPVLYPLDEAKACWRRVTAPTLWVAGRDSVLMKPFAANPDDYRARMGCFAKVREVLIDDCGHNLHHDQPEQLAARLVNSSRSKDDYSTKRERSSFLASSVRRLSTYSALMRIASAPSRPNSWSGGGRAASSSVRKSASYSRFSPQGFSALIGARNSSIFMESLLIQTSADKDRDGPGGHRLPDRTAA